MSVEVTDHVWTLTAMAKHQLGISAVVPGVGATGLRANNLSNWDASTEAQRRDGAIFVQSPA